SIHLEVEAVDPAPVLLLGEMQIEVAHAIELLAERGSTVAVGIGPEVHPDGIQGLWRVVAVHEGLAGVQHVPLIVQAHLDAVIDLLLEIVLRHQDAWKRHQGQGETNRSHGTKMPQERLRSAGRYPPSTSASLASSSGPRRPLPMMVPSRPTSTV